MPSPKKIKIKHIVDELVDASSSLSLTSPTLVEPLASIQNDTAKSWFEDDLVNISSNENEPISKHTKPITPLYVYDHRSNTNLDNDIIVDQPLQDPMSYFGKKNGSTNTLEEPDPVFCFIPPTVIVKQEEAVDNEDFWGDVSYNEPVNDENRKPLGCLDQSPIKSASVPFAKSFDFKCTDESFDGIHNEPELPQKIKVVQNLYRNVFRRTGQVPKILSRSRLLVEKAECINENSNILDFTGFKIISIYILRYETGRVTIHFVPSDEKKGARRNGEEVFWADAKDCSVELLNGSKTNLRFLNDGVYFYLFSASENVAGGFVERVNMAKMFDEEMSKIKGADFDTIRHTMDEITKDVNKFKITKFVSGFQRSSWGKKLRDEYSEDR